MAVKGAIYCLLRIQFWAHLALFISFIQTSLSQDEPLISTPGLPTVTVRGFLNFKTTVDGTVIVFTPASEVPPPSKDPRPEKPSPEPFTSSNVPTDVFLEKDALNSQEGMHDGVQDLNYASPPQNSLENIKTRVPDLNVLENKIKDPFLQHISDNAVLPSAGQVNNDLDKLRKLQSSQNQYPTGLVTVLGGTFVEGPSTTVYETKVIGTYIDGKYAQILQSTSHIVLPPPPVIITTPSLTYSTVERSENSEIPPFSKSILKELPFSSAQKIFFSSQTVKPKTQEPSTMIMESSLETILSTPTISSKETYKTTINQLIEKAPSQRINVIPTVSISKSETVMAGTNEKQNEVKSTTVLESSFVPTEILSTTDKDLPTETLESVKKSSSIRKFSSFIPVSTTVIRLSDDDNTVALSKTHRNSSSRTRFLSPRRPSQTVRLNRFKVKLTLRQDSSDEYNVTLPADDEEMEEDHTQKGEEDVEVITESIGLNVDPARVVFQETTITSEVTLHVGRRKSVRTLTITTSIPLTINPSDIQDILSSQSTAMDESNSDQHIVTRTFTTTERALKTSIVPIFDGKSTMYHTVTESFFIMKIITAYRTLPPGDPSAIESFLNESEISATTLDVAANIQPSVIQTAPSEQIPTEDSIQSSIALPTTGNLQPQVTNPLLSLGHALSNNPLAAVYLGLQQLNAQMTLYSTVTDVSTYVTTDTIYSTKTIRFYDGRSTRHRMISEPVSTKKKTVTTTITSVQPYLNTHAMQQQQQLQKLITATQLNPLQPQYNTITSTYTTVTTTTSLSKRIYTLIYNGFSTKFRTVTSTSLFPTTVTVTTTTKIPIAPTHVNLPFAYPYTALGN